MSQLVTLVQTARYPIAADGSLSLKKYQRNTAKPHFFKASCNSFVRGLSLAPDIVDNSLGILGGVWTTYTASFLNLDLDSHPLYPCPEKLE